MKSFIYTRLVEVEEDVDVALAAEFVDPSDNPLTDVFHTMEDAKTIIEPDDDDEEEEHDCPIAWMYEGLVDAR